MVVADPIKVSVTATGRRAALTPSADRDPPRERHTAVRVGLSVTAAHRIILLGTLNIRDLYTDARDVIRATHRLRREATKAVRRTLWQAT